MMKLVIAAMFLLMVCFAVQVFEAKGQSFPITVQGSLRDGSGPANGTYDIRCLFYSVPTDGAVLGSSTSNSVPVVNGVFTVKLNSLTNLFTTLKSDIWIEFSVKVSGAPTGFTTLAPRQVVASAPLAISALNAFFLDNVPASEIARTSDPRLSDARNPLPGSANYLQNTATVQTANFNISGNGRVGGTFNAGSDVTVAGTVLAAQLNLTGGANANNIDVTSTFGYRIGGSVVLSIANQSTAVGSQAGLFSSGTSNSFFGQSAGRQNSIGADNSFFGAGAGYLNAEGNENSFFGVLAGNNSQGNKNAFFGWRAGIFNTAGNSNTLIGYSSATGGVFTNATAIGANSQVNQNNSLVLGSINGVNGATADTNVGIGTTTPANKLHVNGSIRVTNGAIYITNPNTVIITSPNGACWGITVNNSGGLATFPVSPCP